MPGCFSATKSILCGTRLPGHYTVLWLSFASKDSPPDHAIVQVMWPAQSVAASMHRGCLDCGRWPFKELPLRELHSNLANLLRSCTIEITPFWLRSG